MMKKIEKIRRVRAAMFGWLGCLLMVLLMGCKMLYEVYTYGFHWNMRPALILPLVLVAAIAIFNLENLARRLDRLRGR